MTDHATRARELAVKELVDKFLSWPLPDSVCADLCATKQGAPHRSGTTLLSATEAKQMVEYLFTDLIAAALDQAAQEAVKDMEQRKDAAYLERNQVVAALAKCFPSGIARTAIEGWSEDWHGCVYIDLPTGQVSWHYHDSHAQLFAGLPPYTKPWDGHTTEEKYRRLAALQAAQPVWSTEKPTYDGPWQWRSSKECGRAVIYIRVLPDPMTGVPRIWQDVPNNGTWIDYGEWAPCPLPREAQQARGSSGGAANQGPIQECPS